MTRRTFFTLGPALATGDGEELFDGRSLRGWRWAREGESFQPSWEVRDGLLCGRPGLGRDVYLLTEKSFTDFELRFDWKIAPGGNSGIKYRVQSYGASQRRLEPIGLEYQITDDEANPDALSTIKHSSGAIYDYIAPRKHQLAKAGVWHQGVIRAVGLRIEHWLDGERVVDVDLASEAARAEFELSPRLESRVRLRQQTIRESPLALQIHDAEVCFRSLRLRRL